MAGLGKKQRKARLGLILAVVLTCAILASIAPVGPSGVSISGEGLLSFEPHIARAAFVAQPFGPQGLGNPPASPENWLPGFSNRGQWKVEGISPGESDYQVRVGVSTDGVGIYEYYPDNPIIEPTQGWETGQGITYAPCVLKEGASDYIGWWTGLSSYPGESHIGGGTSTDGLAWTKWANNPKISCGASGQWDDYDLADPSVVKVGSTYYVYYDAVTEEAAPGGCGKGEIGLATTTDPSENTYTKSGSNPVLAMGYNADEYYIARPSVIYEDGLVKMWYDGGDSSEWITGIYYATSSNGTSWTRQGLALRGNWASPDVKRLDDGRLIMAVNNWTVSSTSYDPATRRMDLFVGTDEQTWELVAEDILARQVYWGWPGGTVSEWISNPCLLDEDPNEWRLYFDAGRMTGGDYKIGVAEDLCIAGVSSKAQADLDDVRFTESDGITEVDHYIEGATETYQNYARVGSIEAYKSQFAGAEARCMIDGIKSGTQWDLGMWLLNGDGPAGNVTIDLEGNRTFNKVEIYNYNGSGEGDRGFKDFTVATSPNNSDWTTRVTDQLTQEDGVGDPAAQVFTFSDVTARYVCFNGTTNWGDASYSGLVEIKVIDTDDKKVHAPFWVELDVPSSGNTSFFIYYGNSTVSSASNGDNTFPFFDDFPGSSIDTDKWDTSGTVTVSGGIVTIGASSYIIAKTAYGTNYALSGESATSGVNCNMMIWIENVSPGNNYAGIFRYTPTYPSTFGANTVLSGSGTNYNTKIPLDTAYHRWRIERNSTTDVRFYHGEGIEYIHKSTTYIPTVNLKARFYNFTASGSMTVDYVFVRKYLSTKPPIQPVSTEEVAPEITNIPSSYNFGTVVEGGTYPTGTTYFTVTNTGTETIDITISAGNMTGGTQWTLSDTAEPGDMIYGLKAGYGGTQSFIPLTPSGISPIGNQTRRPTSDDSSSGSWTVYPASPTTHYDKVDEEVADDASTYIYPTEVGRSLYDFTAFSIPSGVTVSYVEVFYRAKDASSLTSNIRSALKVGGNNYDTTDSGVNPAVLYQTYSYEYTVNPKTSTAWTVDDINGVGANALEAFGVYSSDVSPIPHVTQVYAVVVYNEDTWADNDVSALVPAGATGVIMQIANTDSSVSYKVGLRKNGSTDDRTQLMFCATHSWAMIGVDENRIFESYFEERLSQEMYLVGYTTGGVTFFTNAYDKSLSTTLAWTDIDCSTEAPNAIGLIFEVIGENASYPSWYDFGIRKNGSSDTLIDGIAGHSSFSAVIGCDNSQVIESYIENTVNDLYLTGYITSGATFNTNAGNYAIGSEGSYVDLSALPSGAVMGIFDVYTGDSSSNFHLREKGSSEDIYFDAALKAWAIVDSDSNRVIEGKRQYSYCDFMLVGYTTGGYNIVVTSSGASFITDLAGDDSQDWGVEFYTPTNFTDGATKTGVVTLTATLST